MILHVDMDAFYASVEERDQPALRGRPVIVGGTPQGRGVVAAANYVAREFGVRSAMSARRALQLCPHAVCLPCRIDYYAEISREIRTIFHHYTPLVEPLSLDEAFLDARGSEHLFGSSVAIAGQIKREIFERLGLVASVGVAPNKFLAKIASDLEKPDGLVVVEANSIQAFLDPLPVQRLWGVGQSTLQVMHRLGVRTIRDFRQLSAELVVTQLGTTGKHLHQLSQGIDDRQVVPDRAAKSISHETTFREDIDDVEFLLAWSAELVDQVARRLRRNQLRGRTVQMKIRFSDFRTITRSSTLDPPTNRTNELWEAAKQIMLTRLPEKRQPIRLLGFGVAGLERGSKRQRDLFETESEESASLDQAADAIREKFGGAALNRGSQLLYKVRHKPEPRPD